MNRFSILYLFKGSFYHLTYTTRPEAEAAIKNFPQISKGLPLGIYDAKTELFIWETAREKEYNQLAIEEQGRRGNEIISIIEKLRASGLEIAPVEEEPERPLTLPEDEAKEMSSKGRRLAKAVTEK